MSRIAALRVAITLAVDLPVCMVTICSMWRGLVVLAVIHRRGRGGERGDDRNGGAAKIGERAGGRTIYC